MRRVLFSAISLLALTATTAVAADIPRRAALPPAAPAYAPAFNWSGPYIGVNGGYGWSSSNWDGFVADADGSGGLVGLTLGYNWQGIGSPWVFGLEGDIDWTNLQGSFVNVACPTGCETTNSWLATVRGRLGYAIDRVMPYVTGGLAVGDVHANVAGLPGASDTNAGWTVGAGIEVAIAPNITAKAEYLHVDLGSIGCTVTACGAATNVDFRADVVRGGVNLRF